MIECTTKLRWRALPGSLILLIGVAGITAVAQNSNPASPLSAPTGSGSGWINVRSFGARGDGKADDGPSIRAALAALLARGGGTLYFPAGIYRGSVSPNPENQGYKAVGLLSGHMRLLGDGMGSTIIGLLPNQPDHAFVLLNQHIGSGGDEDMTVEDLTVDGFAADQNVKESQTGFGLLRCRNLVCRHVRFSNVAGTANSGPGEGFHVEFGLSTHALFEGCEVVGNAGKTASGFSADSSTDITYLGCEARGRNPYRQRLAAHHPAFRPPADRTLW